MDILKFDAMPFPMFLILIIVLSLIIFLLVIEPRIAKKKLINKNEHGSSKFADLKEIKNSFDKENIRNIKHAGFPIWYEKEHNVFKNAYFDNKSPHYLLVGSTGSGKSVTVSIPLSIHFATAQEKHSVVLTDPKGELFRTTGKIFKDNGYDVITIDFRNPTKSNKVNIMQPIIDEWKEHCRYHKSMIFFLSHFFKKNKISIDKFFSIDKYFLQIQKKYNLLNYIIDAIKINRYEIETILNNKKMYNLDIIKNVNNLKDYMNTMSNSEIIEKIKEYQNLSSKYQAEANRLAISLADLIFVEKEAKDPFWINSSKQLFIGLVGIFLEDYKDGLITENMINISSIKKFQNSSLIKENQSYLQKNMNNRSYGSLSKDYLTSIISAAENTYKSITAVFGEKMSIFDDLNVENITSISEFEFSSIGKRPTVLYIIVPDEDRVYFQLVTIIVGMLIKDLTKFANLPENKGVLPTKVEWILDEFANCPPLNAIETTVSVARSRGMRFYFFIQSFAQLDQVYGKEIASIIQDNAALIYLKTNSVECAEVIAKKLGKATITTSSLNKNTDIFKIGANQTDSLMGRELLTANEIINLKYKTIIFPNFGNPIFRDTYMYSDLYPEYKNYSEYERNTTILKRLTDNYYTVEKMRSIYSKRNAEKVEEDDDEIPVYMKKKMNSDIRSIMQTIKKTEEKFNNIENFIDMLKDMFKDKIKLNSIISNDTYIFEFSHILNNFELSKIKRIKPINIVVEIGINQKNNKNIMILFKNKELEVQL